MSTKEFIKLAKQDKNVYISDVEDAFNQLDDKTEISLVLDLIKEGEVKEFSFYLPRKFDEIEFVEDYFYGKIYNILSTLGGVTMSVYYDTANSQVKNLVNKLDEVFGIGVDKKQRKGYARAINVTDRMINKLLGKKFLFKAFDISDKPLIAKDEDIDQPKLTYKAVVNNLNGLMCGIDIGGTDIKMALSRDNSIVCFKEYDWYPASHPVIDMTTNPILLLVRLLIAKATYDRLGGDENIAKFLDDALDKHASLDEIEECVLECEKAYEGKLELLDGIGMCFPDVVVKNKIVGGEVSKVRGIRENENVDFEEEFSKLSDLNLLLQEYCKEGGVVKITNDGPMASYTAAVEIAYGEGEQEVINGVFAHTLGTELGTGWVDESGHIPEIPLEAYNYVIDLGSYDQRQYEHDDLRSVNNMNTDIPGTVQKYGSQSGVFRLALKYFENERKDLYDELFEKGFVVHMKGGLYVPTEPKDLRKPFLEHVMSLPERENCPVCERIFLEIGEQLAVTWIETEKILCPKEKTRVLFGRVVKNKRCFELMQQGAKRIVPDIEFSLADGDMANTPLMKQLKQDKHYTVAQFAQAVGAIYFAMSDRI